MERAHGPAFWQVTWMQIIVHTMVRPSPCKQTSFTQEGKRESGKAQNSLSLHKKELSPHQIQRPRRFAFVCSVERLDLMSLGSHLFSTGAALVLIAAHGHRLNSADREPSTPKTCPTTSIPQVGVGEKHLCGPSRLSSHLQRKRMKLRGWAQPPDHWAQEQWRGSRQQEQWEVTPQLH